MTKQRQRLVEVPFSKTDCGVDFYINTAYGGECPWVLTEHEVFKTDFFEIFFIKKANGYVLIDYRKITLKDGMVLIVKPHQQQEWHIDEACTHHKRIGVRIPIFLLPPPYLKGNCQRWFLIHFHTCG